MPTIQDVADRIVATFDLDPDAALDVAQTYAVQIAGIDQGVTRDYGPADEVSVEDADFIVDAERHHLTAEGLL